MEKWKRDNYDQLVFKLGAKSDNYDFLNGILFATLASKTTVPQLHNVIQADAAHMNFGKYTLYSTYGNTANANMSPVAFAIIFGNKDRVGWTKFWKFAVETHPSLNSSEITIITDHEKGQIAVIEECLPNAFHFHCTVHCQKNMTSHFNMRFDKVNSCRWMFDHLVECKTHFDVLKLAEKHFDKMSEKAVAYLTEGLSYESQFPASRCAMGPNVYM